MRFSFPWDYRHKPKIVDFAYLLYDIEAARRCEINNPFGAK